MPIPLGTHRPRVKPRMPVQAYQTFGVRMPRATHWRPATCEEAGCLKWKNGWKTPFVPNTPEHDRIKQYIRNSPIKRMFTVLKEPDLWTVVFEAGQPCFKQDHPSTRHMVPLQRPQLHIVHKGDWRQSWDARVVGSNEWVDRFATNQDKLKTLIERG